MKPFPTSALSTFSDAYPEQPVRLDHDLCSHPLLNLQLIAQLATRLRPVDVEYNRGDVPVGLDPAATPSNGLSIAETIRRIEE
ncbi:MAG TPA: transcriptional regulator, partial [Allosphingosinicella sp.]